MKMLLVLVAALALAPGAALAQSSNRYLNAAMKLYRDLEYESALENLKKAEKQAGNSLAEDVQIALYSGLIQFELGNAAGAESAFKAALALDDRAQLPRGISPKVAPVFEKARKEIGRRKPTPTGEVAETPRTISVEAVPLAKPTPLPESEVAAPAKLTFHTIGVAVGIPLLAIGAAIVGGGAYFGWQSGVSVDEAQKSPWESEAQKSLDNAQSQATNANIMFGVGAAVAVAGAATLIAALASSSGEAPGGGAEMPGTR